MAEKSTASRHADLQLLAKIREIESQLRALHGHDAWVVEAEQPAGSGVPQAASAVTSEGTVTRRVR